MSKIRYQVDGSGKVTSRGLVADDYVLMENEGFWSSDEHKAFRDIENQRETCFGLLLETDHKVSSSDYDYPNDVPAWIIFRKEVKDIIKGGVIVTLPDRPF